MTGEKNIDELFKDALDNVREVDAEIDALKSKRKDLVKGIASQMGISAKIASALIAEANLTDTQIADLQAVKETKQRFDNQLDLFPEI